MSETKMDQRVNEEKKKHMLALLGCSLFILLDLVEHALISGK